MTHPVPDSLASDFNLFDETTTEIRALGFATEELNLEVRGAVQGKLKRVRKLKEGVYLYSLPLELQPGRYQIVKSGDWRGTVDFTIGKKVRPFFETPYVNRSSYAWTILFVLMYIPALILSIPWMPSLASTSFKSWILPLRSFALLKSRIATLPKAFQLSIFATTLISVILPIALFDVEGVPCAFHVFGNFFGWHYRYHYLGAKYGMTYLFGMFYPVVNMVNGMNVYRSNILIPPIDFAILVYGLWRWLYDFTWLVDLLGSSYAISSPIMTIIPFILYGNLLAYLIRCVRQRTTEDTQSLKDSALYHV